MTLPELIALARKATPGPYRVDLDRNDQCNIYAGLGTDNWVALLPHQCVRSIKKQAAANAAYLAALSPEVVIALAEVAEAAKEMKETIAANRLMLGHYMGVEWLHREEKSWNAALTPFLEE